MTDERRLAILPLAALLAAAGCSTQVVDTSQVVYPGTPGAPNQGGLFVALAPTASSYEAEEAFRADDPNPTDYHILMDGNRIAFEPADGSGLWVQEGGQVGMRDLPAGPHHFTILAPGAAPIFEGDSQIPDGGSTFLLLYGPLDALQGHFLLLPDAAAAGNEHITLVNLMRDGRTIEAVNCSDGPSCTPLSAPLALGDVYDAELPSDISVACTPPAVPGLACPSTLSSAGVGVGYGLVPSASIPEPPITGITQGIWAGIVANPMPTVFLAAPVYMSDQGQPETVIPVE